LLCVFKVKLGDYINIWIKKANSSTYMSKNNITYEHYTYLSEIGGIKHEFILVIITNVKFN